MDFQKIWLLYQTFSSSTNSEIRKSNYLIFYTVVSRITVENPTYLPKYKKLKLHLLTGVQKIIKHQPPALVFSGMLNNRSLMNIHLFVVQRIFSEKIELKFFCLITLNRNYDITLDSDLHIIYCFHDKKIITFF